MHFHFFLTFVEDLPAVVMIILSFVCLWFNQVQQNILLQAKQQVQAQAQASQQQATNQFSKLPDQPSILTATSTASSTIQPPVPSLLQQKSVLVKSSTTGGCPAFPTCRCWKYENKTVLTMCYSHLRCKWHASIFCGVSRSVYKPRNHCFKPHTGCSGEANIVIVI